MLVQRSKSWDVGTLLCRSKGILWRDGKVTLLYQDPCNISSLLAWKKSLWGSCKSEDKAGCWYIWSSLMPHVVEISILGWQLLHLPVETRAGVWGGLSKKFHRKRRPNRKVLNRTRMWILDRGGWYYSAMIIILFVWECKMVSKPVITWYNAQPWSDQKKLRWW